jgi:hypothetical protein
LFGGHDGNITSWAAETGFWLSPVGIGRATYGGSGIAAATDEIQFECGRYFIIIRPDAIRPDAI